MRLERVDRVLNYLWAGMILIGVVYAAFTGRLPELTNAALDSSKEAVTLCITMMGVMAFWSGLMEIGSEAGLIRAMSGKMRPVVRFLFPGLPEEHPAVLHITTNMIANILGLGWAATPAGLKAMEALAELEESRRKQETSERQERYGGRQERHGKRKERHGGRGREMPPVYPPGTANNEMCTFLILNISSLQLIPVNVIAYRSQYGSVNPAAIVGAGILATTVSTGVAVLFCKIMDYRSKYGGKR